MFKIHDDKVYFVAETPDINKVIEIFLPKDDRGTIMDSHEIRVDLCRAVIHMEKKGVRVLKVRNIEDTNKASIDIWHMPEYQEAAESPVSDVVNACIESCFDSGAMFNLPCKANRKTHEVFAVECCASPDDDDSFSYEFPKKVEAARLADKIAHTFIADDNESQRIAKSVCAYCSRELNDRKNMTITIGTGDDNGISVKVSCDTLLHYEPTSKEVFVNVKSASKNEREKINQYVKDNGTFVSEDLVPMSLLQSVVSYGWEHWNRDFPE